MSEVKLSKRAEKIWEWVRCHPALDAGSSKSRNNTGSRLGGRDDSLALAIRQQTLADLLGCSRRSIYRALKQLKEQGYLVETKKRENRCKIYQCHPVPRIESGASFDTGSRTGSRVEARDDSVPPVKLCHLAKFYLDNCQTVFKYNFPESFDWEKFFPEATHKIRHVEHQTKFWRLMFDNLYLIQERETGKPHSARVDNPDSTLFGVSYPKEPPLENLEHRMRTRPAYRPLR